MNLRDFQRWSSSFPGIDTGVLIPIELQGDLEVCNVLQLDELSFKIVEKSSNLLFVQFCTFPVTGICLGCLKFSSVPNYIAKLEKKYRFWHIMLFQLKFIHVFQHECLSYSNQIKIFIMVIDHHNVSYSHFTLLRMCQLYGERLTSVIRLGLNQRNLFQLISQIQIKIQKTNTCIFHCLTQRQKNFVDTIDSQIYANIQQEFLLL